MRLENLAGTRRTHKHSILAPPSRQQTNAQRELIPDGSALGLVAHAMQPAGPAAVAFVDNASALPRPFPLLPLVLVKQQTAQLLHVRSMNEMPNQLRAGPDSMRKRNEATPAAGSRLGAAARHNWLVEAAGLWRKLVLVADCRFAHLLQAAGRRTRSHKDCNSVRFGD